MRPKRYILPLIIFAQFCCTSLWFASNAVIADLIYTFNLSTSALAHLTSAVQFGFIVGTFVFALLTIADRFSPSKVFFFSAIFGAVSNALIGFGNQNLESLLLLRFLTGFFLAGIYPVGMKIASDYFKEKLGKSLGFLVGALVLGTAFPHLLKGLQYNVPWQSMVWATSIVASFGGILVLVFVPDGPFKTRLQKFDISLFYRIFKIKRFRTAAFGYFGHMWELYAFWAFVPVYLKTYFDTDQTANFNMSLLSFFIIAVGSLGCIISGYLSRRYTAKKIALLALTVSCICCVLSPAVFYSNLHFLFIAFLTLWGMAVIADSPLFSTIVAQNVPSEYKGTALTIVNSIGFAITIVSIQFLDKLQNLVDTGFLFVLLAIGPILGLINLYRNK